MKKLRAFNMGFPQGYDIKPNPRKREQEHPEMWAGHKVRRMLQTLYTVSMLRLLRYDEALRIRRADIELTEADGAPAVILKLPFRKTDQTGGTSLHRFGITFAT